MPTNSLLRSSLSVNSRHHQSRTTTSGMTSSSSATSSNSNNLNNERHRDNSRSNDLQKTTNGANTFSDSRDDGDSSKDGSPINRLQAQNGKNFSQNCTYLFVSAIRNPWVCTKFYYHFRLYKYTLLENGIRIDLKLRCFTNQITVLRVNLILCVVLVNNNEIENKAFSVERASANN